MADETNTGTPVTTPVTSQDVTPPSTGPDPLEAQHSQDNFKALSALFDQVEGAQPTGTVATQPPAPTPVGTETTPPATQQPPPTDEFEKTLDGIQPSERAHPNVIKGMDELRRISREEHKARAEAELRLKEYETKVADYEKKLQTPTIPEETQKELEDLRNLRKELDLKLDPDFQKTYIQPVQEAETNILNILKEAGLKDEHVKFIQDHGGIIAMSRSNEVMDLGGKQVTAQQWVNDELFGRTPIFHKNRALGELTNALNIQDKANRELQDFQTKGKERWEAKVQKFRTEFDAGRDEAIAELGDAVKPKIASPTATAEEKLAIEAHNKRLAEAAARFEEYIKTSQDPKVSGKIVVKATQADVLAAANKELEAQVASLTDRINKIKAAGNTSQAGDHTVTPPAVTQQTPKDLLRTPDQKALSDLLTGAGVTR